MLAPELGVDGFRAHVGDTGALEAAGEEVGFREADELGACLEGGEDGGVDGGFAGLYIINKEWRLAPTIVYITSLSICLVKGKSKAEGTHVLQNPIPHHTIRPRTRYRLPRHHHLLPLPLCLRHRYPQHLCIPQRIPTRRRIQEARIHTRHNRRAARAASFRVEDVLESLCQRALPEGDEWFLSC